MFGFFPSVFRAFCWHKNPEPSGGPRSSVRRSHRRPVERSSMRVERTERSPERHGAGRDGGWFCLECFFYGFFYGVSWFFLWFFIVFHGFSMVLLCSLRVFYIYCSIFVGAFSMIFLWWFEGFFLFFVQCFSMVCLFYGFFYSIVFLWLFRDLEIWNLRFVQRTKHIKNILPEKCV